MESGTEPASIVARRCARAVAVVLAVCASVVPAATAEPASAGLEFYSPAPESVAGEHGSVISSQPIAGEPGLPGARNFLVLYRSVDVHGQPVAVSGTVAVPEGTPPAGGWPLVSWAHGTTGTADVCAPSRDTGAGFPAHDYTSLTRETLARWIAAGYAVAQTDYQGLGTPGPHGYLIGEAEQRAVADMALAARVIAPEIGTRWVAMGHSQGGQAAVYANARSQQWAPQLRLLGAVAMAPASHLGPVVQAFTLARRTGIAEKVDAPAGSVSFIPLFIRGAQTVADIDPSAFLTAEADSMVGQADDRCIGQLRARDSWGGLGAGDTFSADADPGALVRVLDDNDPSGLALTTPMLVLQGKADTVVLPAGTDAMVAQQQLTGQPVEYRTYPGVDHRAILGASNDDALAWVNARFAD
ncbi:alpha/beta hydrolase family protein [Nocardia sp. NPDC057272]|uniref:alpha/beta hydrolase family protein n=1 Tax=Nocardia sp. NPDC057272 TaxID=3346079 RepID=UPI0036422099